MSKGIVLQTQFDINVAGAQFLFEVHPEREVLSEVVRRYGDYSRFDLELIRKFAPQGSVFIDMGANIGWHTLFAAQVVGPNGRVIAFEPDPKNVALLKKNLERNGVQNVLIDTRAVSDSTRKDMLFHSAVNFGDHIVGLAAGPTAEHSTSRAISCIAFDEFIAEQQINPANIHMIKMDIQGSEAKAFAGMHGFLKNHRPHIIMEYSPLHIRRVGSSVFELLAMMDKYSYKPFLMVDNPKLPPQEALKELTAVDIIQMTPKMEADPRYMCVDLLLRPPARP